MVRPMADDPHASLLQRAFTEVRGLTDDPVETVDRTRLKLLDAAYDVFCRMGIQRASMEEVARRAGVSRITVYRKFTTKDALAEEVIAREFRRYFEQFVADIAAADTVADRVVCAFVSSFRAIAGNTLIGGLLETEPDQLLGSTEATGRTLATVSAFVAGQLRREQHAGTVSTDLDVDLTAEMMVRISASFLTVPSGIVDIDDDDSLAELARRYLVPMLGAPSR